MSKILCVLGAVLVAAVSGQAAFGDDAKPKADAKPAAAPAPAPAPAAAPAAATEKPSSVLSFTMKDIDGKPVKLGEKYKGNVLLIVNTASKCGYTPQYEDLESIYEKYHKDGFEILAFPANDFGHQEPGTEAEIKEFCTSKFHVTFPMFTKITVKGPEKDALYAYITSPDCNPATTGEIKWNFTKFLVDRDGKVIARFEPPVKPSADEVQQAIQKAIAAKPAAPKA